MGLPADTAECFVQEDINGAALLSLTESDLERLGVIPMGPRKRLMLAIAQLIGLSAPGLVRAVGALVSLPSGEEGLRTCFPPGGGAGTLGGSDPS